MLSNVLVWGMFRILIPLLLTIQVAYASETINFAYPSLYISKIVPKNSQEENGDELFFEILEIDNNNKKVIFRVPQFPSYWTTNKLDQINDFLLWKGVLKEGMEKTLIISLIDQDFPPWNNNDIIGIIKVELTLIDGNIQSKWSNENGPSGGIIATANDSEHIQKFKLSSEKASYHINIGLTETKKLSGTSLKKDDWPTQFPRPYTGMFLQ